MDMNLRILRLLVRRTDTRELLDLARPRLLIQTLGVTLLGLFDGDVDEDFDERERGFVSVGYVGVQFAREVAVGFVGGYEGGEG